MDSNITLRSNIYINATARSDDKPFLQHITDYKILKRYQKDSYGFQNNMSWMTSVQLEILRQGQPNCSLEHGTMSWGVPVGGNRMVCRCEQYDCPRYEKCSQYDNFQHVLRNNIQERDEKEKETVSPLPLYFPERDTFRFVEKQDLEQPGSDIVLETLETISDIQDETTQEFPVVSPSTEADKEQETEHEKIDIIEKSNQDMAATTKELPISTEAANSEQEIVEAVSQQVIIDADVSERIWVNAGPGTGKTYTVIQRLKKLLAEDLDGAILVLCFSRNAVQVIRERLLDELGPTVSSYIDDGHLVIRTFDSFATYMLEDELNPGWDYNRRIEEFIKMLGRNTGSLNEMLSYLIIDEIQDTVGVRARMLLALLDELKCGVLLLGDSCQAIFDWTIRDASDMPFSMLSNELAKRRCKRYELLDNRRQNGELAKQAAILREKLLVGSTEEQETAVQDFKNWVREKWHTYQIKSIPQLLVGRADLILCKTNGEAAYISQQLFDDPLQVSHIMKQSSNHRSLAPWIAKVLHGNDGSYMSKVEFMQNAEAYEIEGLEEKWNALKSLDGHSHSAVLHIQDILSALRQKDSLPDICINRPQDCIVVSTVHRAKGSEAERVYWLDSPLVYDSQQDQDGVLEDAVKAAYVAATRAKKDIHILAQDKKLYMRRVNEARWIQIGWSKSKKPYCKGILFLPEDVDSASFAAAGNAEEIQTVLSCLEPGMPVTLYPNEEFRRFDIYFDDQMIGSTSSDFTEGLFAGFEATNHNRQWPYSIPDVYISAVTTVTNPERIDIDGDYKTAGCWLGIELGGFPTIQWT